LTISIIVMLRLDARLALLVIAFGPLPAVIGAIAAKEQTAREKHLMERWTRIFARFNEVLSGMLVVKSFVMEESEKRRFLGGVDRANAVVVQGVATDARTTALKNVVMAIARVAALAVGGVLVVRHEISLGTLLAFLGYVGGMFMPVQALTGLYQTLLRGSVAVDTLFEILDEHDSLGDAHDAIEPPRLAGGVELRHVRFGYRPGREIVDDVSLTVRPGERVAIVGPSGAGKTTLMVLLQRLYDPWSGSILLDGTDIRRFKQRSMRKQIGVVLQEGTLFSDSVHANIGFGRPGATRDEIEAAARAANAHDFITAMPEGYETAVGERGARLSGGERQRIAIARAILKNPPILILVEATSALDAESEALVQEALVRLMANRTSFVIAHRLSTVTHADRILVFRDGRITEQGTHAELVAAQGYYASLVERQVRGLRTTRAA
jgi:ATP-binding cassette subfamily B protein